MKKCISLIVGIMFLLCGSSYAFAADELESGYSVTVNEYDVYVAEREQASIYQHETGVATNSVDKAITSGAIEEKLLQLSRMSDFELIEKGFTLEQISILHDYKGERIESNPSLRSVFSSLTATFFKAAASDSSIGVRVEWAWDSTPIVNTSKDMVVLRWKGTNSAGSSLNLALNKAKSSCTERFYALSSDNYSYSKNISLNTQDAYGCVYASIPMTDSSNEVYAKTGRMIVYIDKTGSNAISEAAFTFAYGHSSLGASISFSLPASFGVSFSKNCDKMIEKSIRINSAGKITAY